MSLAPQQVAQQTATGEWMLQVQLVDAVHQRQVALAHWSGLVVRGAAADVEQLGLALHVQAAQRRGLFPSAAGA
jgi:hypothetical protein